MNDADKENIKNEIINHSNNENDKIIHENMNDNIEFMDLCAYYNPSFKLLDYLQSLNNRINANKKTKNKKGSRVENQNNSITDHVASLVNILTSLSNRNNDPLFPLKKINLNNLISIPISLPPFLLFPPQDLYKEFNDISFLLNLFGTCLENGLSFPSHSSRQIFYGKNKLSESNGKLSLWLLLLEPLKDSLIWLWILCTIIAGWLDWPSFGSVMVMSLVLVINFFLSIWQEWKAQYSQQQIRLMDRIDRVSTLRNGNNNDNHNFSNGNTIQDYHQNNHHINQGRIWKIDSTDLVPGDIILLREGDAIPADCRILKIPAIGILNPTINQNNFKIETRQSNQNNETNENDKIFKIETSQIISNHLLVTESQLTGESEAVIKVIGDSCYMGSTIESGSAIALVCVIGPLSQLGQIKQMIDDADIDIETIEDKMNFNQSNNDGNDNSVNNSNSNSKFKSPVKASLKRITIVLFILGVVLCILIVLMGYFCHGKSLDEMIRISITLGISVVPESLPAILVWMLILASGHLANVNHILVKKINCIEKLRGIDWICIDKTGTITEGKMKVIHYSNLETIEIGSLCCPTVTRDLNGNLCGNGMEVAIVLKAKEFDLYHDISPFPISITSKQEPKEEYKEPKEEYKQDQEPKEQERTEIEINGKWKNLCIIGEIPFDSNRKMSSVILKDEFKREIIVCAKGATEFILEKCKKKLENENENANIDSIKNMEHELTFQGLVVLAVAKRVISISSLPLQFDSNCKIDDYENDLEFVGLIGLMDPPRPHVKASIEKCLNAGIRVTMITGDHPSTAYSIAERVGIVQSQSLNSSIINNINNDSFQFSFPCLNNNFMIGNGEKFSSMSLLKKKLGLDYSSILMNYSLQSNCDYSNGKRKISLDFNSNSNSPSQSLLDQIEFPSIFARVTPKDKYRIIKHLQDDLGKSVLMTGDGINDAAAIKLASIGVSMGLTGTQVARDASDLILLDDDFASIPDAIFYGRHVWSNLKRYLTYLLATTSAEVMIMTFATILGWESPMNANSILWANLVADIWPAILLKKYRKVDDLKGADESKMMKLQENIPKETNERESKRTFKSKSKFNQSQSLITLKDWILIVFAGLVISTFTLIAFKMKIGMKMDKRNGDGNGILNHDNIIEKTILIEQRSGAFLVMTTLQLFVSFFYYSNEGMSFECVKDYHLVGMLIFAMSMVITGLYWNWLANLIRLGPVGMGIWKYLWFIALPITGFLLEMAKKILKRIKI